MKKTILAILLSITSLALFARPHRGGGFRPTPRPAPMHHFRPAPPPRIAPAWTPSVRIGPAWSPVSVNVALPVPPPPPPVRIWVPATYVTEYDVYGRPYQRLIPGHWEYR